MCLLYFGIIYIHIYIYIYIYIYTYIYIHIYIYIVFSPTGNFWIKRTGNKTCLSFLPALRPSSKFVAVGRFATVFLASLSIPANPAECADEVVEKRWKASSYSKLKADSRFKLDHVVSIHFSG